MQVELGQIKTKQGFFANSLNIDKTILPPLLSLSLSLVCHVGGDADPKLRWLMQAKAVNAMDSVCHGNNSTWIPFESLCVLFLGDFFTCACRSSKVRG
jgi:hypothetical protein